MKKTELKSFDIASFDIELEYNSKIAPIHSKIQKLNKNHETKSLKAHKDFLDKEKKSKEKFNLLRDKAVLKDQRIEKAAENKIIKLQAKAKRFSKQFDDYKVLKEAEYDLKHTEIKERIKELELNQIEDINLIKEKYDKNVTSYIEKLDTYNNNYENNKKLHKQQVIEYDQLLVSKLNEISEMKKSLDQAIEKKLSDFIEEKKLEDDQTLHSFDEIEKNLNNQTTHIRMESNMKIKDIKSLIKTLSSDYKVRSKDLIDELNKQITTLENDFISKKELIEKDLELHLDQVNEELTNDEVKLTLKIKKAIKMKTDFFNLRASTTIGYEERILHEKIQILRKEIEFTEETLNYELKNLEKLQVLLLSDQNELKDIGDCFKEANINLKRELNNFELANNNYLVKLQKLKTDFVSNYTTIFDGFKNKLLTSNKSRIDQLTEINQEIDEINKYLDTADPLKEIKVNRLRESIEINEVKEKYNIRFAKQQHAIKLLNNELKNLLELEKLDIKDKEYENNKEITIIKNKEQLDKDLVLAKNKYEEAEETYKLRLNSTKLETILLAGKYEKELDIFEYEKEISEIEVQRNNILISKELEMEIKNINLEANYRIEVINKRLEEDLLKLDEEVNKYVYEKDSFSSHLDLEISKENLKAEKARKKIHSNIDQKIALIDKALEREIKDPMTNLANSQAIIDERLSKFDHSNSNYQEFIIENTNLLANESLGIEEIKAFASNSTDLIEKAKDYINETFESLDEALVFMSELELRKINHKISTSNDSGTIKKLKKILHKIKIEIKKQKTSVKNSRLDYESAIKNQILADLTKFDKLKIEDLETLKKGVINIYSSSFDALKTIQARVIEQVRDLYDPITRTDTDLIQNAKKNAQKAIALVEEERINDINPINKALIDFTNQAKTRKQDKLDELDDLISKLRSTIKSLKDNAQHEVTKIKDDIFETVSEKTNLLHSIDENEGSEIVKQKEAIDAKKRDLENLYNETLDKLAEKDREAKKIFDYEERIYNIAVETANSHYNDSMNKTENDHLLNIQKNNKARDDIAKNADNYLKEITKELLDLTSEFEKNIFTTRPKLEESIGDAQKEIDKESKEKEKRLKILLETHEKITTSLEDGLFTHFQDGYTKIQENLNSYLEKYKVFTDDYNSSISMSNDVISQNSIVFSSTLFDQSRKKFDSTLKKLLDINEE